MLIDNKPIAEAVDKFRKEYDLSWQKLAYEIGYRRKDHRWRKKIEGDTSKLKRALGLQGEYSGKRKEYKLRKRMSESNALMFIRFIGRAPIDFGL